MVQSVAEVRRTGPGRPREFDTEAAALAAADVFWKYGYNAASIDDICKKTRAIARKPLRSVRGQERHSISRVRALFKKNNH